ncbi:hypothetical protein OG21DRAFT_1492442 [Imleria badia]|nr:hypothetical protein OG21DRAFT_1492442 [Imleria badia]
MIDLLKLPSPRPLLPSLLEAGFSHEIASAASKLYQQRAEQFKRRTEAMLIAAWQKIATLPGASTSSLDPLTGKDLSTFTEVYLRCLEEWKEEMVQLLRQASKVPSKAAPPKNSHSFNHEYLPLLEHFFEENPFPKHADKVFLAKKSNMQYRQIHVWFQNRRNRTKKEGKPLRKKPISEGATKPLDKLCERMKGYVVKPVSQASQLSQASLSGVDDQLRSAQNNASKCAFVTPPPPHAFPSSYPPPCAYDPFPCKSGPTSFEKPEWRRVSCSNPPISVFIDIDDLVEKFYQLNVRDDTRIKGSPRPQSNAATAAITVIPSRAPHPSRIVHPNYVHAVLHHPPTRVSTSRLHAFQGPTPTPKPVTLMPVLAPSHQSEPFTKWKTAPLPQRFPGRIQHTKRDTTPSECSSTSSSSRMFSAGSKSRSCSLSSVNASSSPTNVVSIQELASSPSR